MASELFNPAWDRKFKLEAGETKLRTHVPGFAPFKFTLLYEHELRRWEVQTQYMPEGRPSVVLGREDLENFPSDTLIAQAVLVA